MTIWQYGVLCIGVMVAASGCSSDNTSQIDTTAPSVPPPSQVTATPADTDTATASAPAPGDTAEQGTVVPATSGELDATAVLDKFFNKCLPAAEKEPLQARKHLRPCAGGPQLDVTAPSVLKYHEQGWEMRGVTGVGTPHVEPVSPTDVDVRTCLDESDVTTWDATTGEHLVTGESAIPKLFRLHHTDTGWLVWATATVEDQRKDICG